MTARARAGCEAGQTTALVCAMLFTLVMFVALVANVGQLVNRRVSLQLLADGGAWIGATVQAVQLNHYAVLEPADAERVRERVGGQPRIPHRRMLFEQCRRPPLLLRRRGHGTDHRPVHEQGG